MKNILELKERKFEIIQEQRGLLDKADNEKRNLSDAENDDFKRLERELDTLDKDILAAEKDEERRKRLAEKEIAGKKSMRGYNPGLAEPDRIDVTESRAAQIKGFTLREDQLSEADFFRCLANKDFGPLASYRAENRTGAVINIGAAGGFAIPEMTRLAVLDGLLANQGLFARVGKEFVEGSDTLNAVTYENNDIDDYGLYGFSLPEFIAEGGSITAGTPRMVKREWHLRKLVSETKISIEAASTGVLGNSLRGAIQNVLRYGLEKYTVAGTGAKQPVGLIDAPCSVTRTRAGAGAISYADVYNMTATTRLSPGNCWIASQTIIPQLAGMVDAGNHAVWMPGVSGGAAQAMPQMLQGFPLLFNIGVSPALGSKGDLIFCSDLSFYKAVIFQDIFVQTSDSAYWSTGELGLRVIMLLDMGALPAKPITVGGSTFGWHTVLSA